MKTYKYLSIIAGIFLFLGVTSCSDFLETHPSNSLTSDNAIETEEDLANTLRGAYSGLLGSSYYGCDFIVQGDVQGDDVQTISSGLRTENFYKFSYRVHNAPVYLWYTPYVVINRANVLLKAAEGFEQTDFVKDVMGQALALRALCHFNLTITYGYPYLKDNGASLGASIADYIVPASELPSRSTVAQCYTAVVKDLTDALVLIGTAKNNGKFNKTAVEALLARVYLYKGDWDNAFTYAESVIGSGIYSLLPREQYVEAWELEYNSESVFDLHISDFSSGNRELLGYIYSPEGYGAMCVTKDFEDLINEDPDDIRVQLLTPTSASGQFYMNKYPGRKGYPTVNNMRILRLSDIYLIASEAALKKASPDQTKANGYLNDIRKRANPTLSDVVATEDLILKERRKELVEEGHRFFDAMRLGKTLTRAGGYHFFTNIDLANPNWNDYRIVKAIPQDEIDVNPNIKDQQNPGYN